MGAGSGYVRPGYYHSTLGWINTDTNFACANDSVWRSSGWMTLTTTWTMAQLEASLIGLYSLIPPAASGGQIWCTRLNGYVDYTPGGSKPWKALVAGLLLPVVGAMGGNVDVDKLIRVHRQMSPKHFFGASDAPELRAALKDYRFTRYFL
jgi:hypothetical protein